MASDPVLIHTANAKAAGEKYGVSPADILAILSVEGGTAADGSPVAPADGMGPPSYGQFIYSTGKSLGVKFGDSASETDAIARYLNQLGYQRDRRTAFAKYNGGPGNPQYDYAAKVIAAAKRYAGLGTGQATILPGLKPEASSSSDGGGGLFSGLGEVALKGLLWVALALAGAALAVQGAARMAGMRTPWELAGGKASA